MKKFGLLALIVFLTATVCMAQDLNNTNLRHKIGQMLIVGFNGTKLTSDNPLYDDLKNDRISGVIIFSKDVSSSKDVSGKGKNIKNVQNPKQLKKLISDIKTQAVTKPFITIDEEGGKITRLPEERGFDTVTLSHKELGDKNDEMTTYLEAKKIAQTLHGLGINVNFAPCVDLGINPNSPVIYKKGRAFSDNPQIVIRHANSFILAHNQYGILTAIKHFPGHGSASGDTHKGLVDVSDTWSKKELEPYKALIDSGMAQAIMVSHVYNKNIDENYPASLSEKTINGILKKDMGFLGLIITDDIQMSAVKDNYGFCESIINAVNAGVDIVIVGNNLNYDKDIAKKFNDIIFNAVCEGKISKERIDESYIKIMHVKERI